MLNLKECVKASGTRPEILLAIMVAHSVYSQHGYCCMPTSLLDGEHGAGSLHPVGLAVDLRIRHLPSQSIKEKIAREIQLALTGEYDVILEPTHIHIEFQPQCVYELAPI